MLIGGKAVSALGCLLDDWLPFLKRRGLARHPACEASSRTRFRCEVCPPLFPTFPGRGSEMVRAVSVTEITRSFRRMAELIGEEPAGYTSHSCRLGGYSTATAADCLPHEAAVALRWSSERVPMTTYKRQSVVESKAVGSAIQRGLKAAKGEAAVVAREVSEPIPEKSLCPFRNFPMNIEVVGKTEVCRRFQFGVCLEGEGCKRAHVCHACGARHPKGGLCEKGRANVERWLAQSKGSKGASLSEGSRKKVSVNPSRRSARLGEKRG